MSEAENERKGNRLSKIITRTDGQKEKMRREMWSKVDIG